MHHPDDAPPVPTHGPRGVVVGSSDDAVPVRPGHAGSGEPALRRPWAAPAAVGGLVATATTVLAVRSPHATGSYGVCPLLALTGLWCPFCGGLRAVHDLTRLDLAGAWAMNPLFVLGVPVLVAAWAWWLGRALGVLPGRARAPRGPVAWPAWVLLAVVLAFGVARNLPALGPWLAPG